MDREAKTITVNVAVNLINNDATLLAQYRDELIERWNATYSHTDENGVTSYPNYLCYRVIFNLDVTTDRRDNIQPSRLGSSPYSDNNRHDIVIIDQTTKSTALTYIYDWTIWMQIEAVYEEFSQQTSTDSQVIEDVEIMRRLSQQCDFYYGFDYKIGCKNMLDNLAQRWLNYSSTPLAYARGYALATRHGVNSSGVQTDEGYSVVAYHTSNVAASMNITIHEIAHLMGVQHEENVLSPSTSSNIDAVTLSPAYFYTIFQNMGLECEWSYRIANLRYHNPTTYDGMDCIDESLMGEAYHWDETAEFTYTFRAGTELVTFPDMTSAFVVSGTAQLNISNLDYSEWTSDEIMSDGSRFAPDTSVIETNIQDGVYEITGLIFDGLVGDEQLLQIHLAFAATQSAREEIYVEYSDELVDYSEVMESGITDNVMEYALFHGLYPDPSSISSSFSDYLSSQNVTPLGIFKMYFSQYHNQNAQADTFTSISPLPYTTPVFAPTNYTDVIDESFHEYYTSEMTLYYPNSMLGLACYTGANGQIPPVDFAYGDWEGFEDYPYPDYHWIPTVTETTFSAPSITQDDPSAAVFEISGFEIVSLEAY